MEFLVVLYDFFKVKVRKRSIPNILITLLLLFVTYRYYDSLTRENVRSLLGSMITVIGILLGFTASVFAVIFTGKNKKIEEAKKSFVTKKVSLYDSLVLGYVFLIFLFGIEIVVTFLLLFFKKNDVLFELLFYFNSFLFVFSIFQLLSSFLELYFVITKTDN